MRTCIMTIHGKSPYSQSKHYEAEAQKGETKDDVDARCWREHCHADEDGNIFIPGFAFKQALDGAAKMAGGKIPGKGSATYSKLFTTGVLVLEDVPLGIKVDELGPPAKVYCHADGRRGSGKRVWRRFPLIPKWECEVPVTITDDTIPVEVFERVARTAGRAQGIGRFRPENGGTHGRFDIIRFEWTSEE